MPNEESDEVFLQAWLHNLLLADTPRAMYSRQACIDHINTRFSGHGLRLIGPAEAAVLDACKAMTDEGIDAATGQSLSVDKALEAELARRKQEPSK